MCSVYTITKVTEDDGAWGPLSGSVVGYGVAGDTEQRTERKLRSGVEMNGVLLHSAEGSQPVPAAPHVGGKEVFLE